MADNEGFSLAILGSEIAQGWGNDCDDKNGREIRSQETRAPQSKFLKILKKIRAYLGEILEQT